MLTANKEVMKLVFLNMLDPAANGMLYKAAKEAYYAVLKPKQPTGEVNLDIEQYVTNDMDNIAKDMSETFAKTFVNSLKDSKFHEELATQIDNHVKSIEVNLIVPTHGALAGAMGPVTGTLTGNVNNGAIF